MMAPIQRTVNGYDPFEVCSAIQKCIRRGLERDAMLWCLEMAHTSKAYYSWMLSRLRVVAHEDIGLAAPAVVQFVLASTVTAYDMYDKQGWRIMFGNCVRALCRAVKSREGDHFVWVMLHEWNASGPGAIPDAALDQHTRRGKAMGRGIEHFLDVGTQLDNPSPDDLYRDEAYALKRQHAQVDDPDDDEPSVAPRENFLF
jgi:replication-associated recombination protein RarA